MDFKKYQDLAMRTNNDKGLEMNRLHGVTGIVTELGELIDAYKRNIWYGTALDTTNVTEEVGDILWYVALLSYSIGSDALTLEPAVYLSAGALPPASELSEDMKVNNKWLLIQLLDSSLDAGGLANCVVEEFGNDFTDPENPATLKDFHTEIDMKLFTFHTGLRIFCELAEVSMAKAAEINIAKLKARYPGKFTEEAAVNRNTVTERNLLESQINS